MSRKNSPPQTPEGNRLLIAHNVTPANHHILRSNPLWSVSPEVPIPVHLHGMEDTENAIGSIRTRTPTFLNTIDFTPGSYSPQRESPQLFRGVILGIPSPSDFMGRGREVASQPNVKVVPIANSPYPNSLLQLPASSTPTFMVDGYLGDGITQNSYDVSSQQAQNGSQFLQVSSKGNTPQQITTHGLASNGQQYLQTPPQNVPFPPMSNFFPTPEPNLIAPRNLYNEFGSPTSYQSAIPSTAQPSVCKRRKQQEEIHQRHYVQTAVGGAQEQENANSSLRITQSKTYRLGSFIIMHAKIPDTPRAPFNSLPGGGGLVTAACYMTGGAEDKVLTDLLDRLSLLRMRSAKIHLVQEIFMDRASRTICAINCQKMQFCYSENEKYDAEAIASLMTDILLSFNAKRATGEVSFYRAVLHK